MRETVDAKARRYLAEGRLLVERIDESGVIALCRGSEEVYELQVDDGGDAWCSCAARGRCAHLAALELVTLSACGADGPTA